LSSRPWCLGAAITLRSIAGPGNPVGRGLLEGEAQPLGDGRAREVHLLEAERDRLPVPLRRETYALSGGMVIDGESGGYGVTLTT